MKKNVSQKMLLAAAIVLMFNFSSCGKYEEGPKLSLKSKTARLTNEWEVKDIDWDGEDNDFMDDMTITFEFEKGGDFKTHIEGEYTVSWYGYTYTMDIDDTQKGEWEWADGKDAVIIELDDADDEEEFEILRLKSNELKFEDEDGNIYECETAE